jgi:hypothetical protein
VTYETLPQPVTVLAPLDPDRDTHYIAMRVRSKHTPHAAPDICTYGPQVFSYRQWHIYGDCQVYDPLCAHGIFAIPWDQFQDAAAGLVFQYRYTGFELE